MIQISTSPAMVLPISIGRNRLSSQLPATGQIPLRRFLHASASRLIPETTQQDGPVEDHIELTGAAKLFAEARAEEEEEAKRPKRFTPRASVAVDDSPIWTGEESTRDAVLRMLVDSRKPLRGDFRTADVRMKEIIKSVDTTPIIRPTSGSPPAVSSTSSSSVLPSERLPVSAAIERERAIPAAQFKPWHAEYVTNDRALTPQVLYGKFINTSSSGGRTSLLDRPALPTDPKARKAELEKRRSGAKIGRLEGAREGALDYRLGGGQGYQAKGASAAGGGVKGGPSGMRAWGNVVEERIERARANGWFDNVNGRGKPIASDPNQHNPHIDRSEFFLNRIIKKQGAKPPWIEVLQELDHAHEAFRATLMASYSRTLVRSLVTSPFQDYNTLSSITVVEAEGMRDGKWQLREAAYHAESITQLNRLVRKMNNIAPQPVRRGLVTLEDELKRMYSLSGPVIVEELAKRRAADWDKVGGVGGDDRLMASRTSGGGAGNWDVDLGIVRGVKRLLNRTGLFRIHVLGVGAIGTLLATHLRRQLQPPEDYPITLMLRQKGLSQSPISSDRTSRGETAHQRPITLALEAGGSTLSSSDFEYEPVGPALDQPMTTDLPAGATSPRTTLMPINNGRIQCLIVTLKCHDTLRAIEQIQHRLSPSSVIVLLQNGMGVYDQLCKDVWPNPWLRPDFVLGSTTHGAAITHQRREKVTAETGEVSTAKERLHRLVIHHGRGDIKLGVVPDPRGMVDYDSSLFPAYSAERSSLVTLPPSPRIPLPSLAATPGNPSNLSQILSILLSITPLAPSLLPITLMQNHLLLKLCVNCAINPITAVLGVKNGALLDERTQDGRWARRMIKAVAKECSQVMLAHLSALAGVRGPADPSQRSSEEDPSIPLELREFFSAPSLQRRILAVCTDTANNTSSMLSDVQAGKYTEVEHINGYIIDLGARLGIQTSVNQELRRLVKTKAGAGVTANREKIEYRAGRERARLERRARRGQAAPSRIVAKKYGRRDWVVLASP